MDHPHGESKNTAMKLSQWPSCFHIYSLKNGEAETICANVSKNIRKHHSHYSQSIKGHNNSVRSLFFLLEWEAYSPQQACQSLNEVTCWALRGIWLLKKFEGQTLLLPLHSSTRRANCHGQFNRLAAPTWAANTSTVRQRANRKLFLEDGAVFGSAAVLLRCAGVSLHEESKCFSSGKKRKKTHKQKKKHPCNPN